MFRITVIVFAIAVVGSLLTVILPRLRRHKPQSLDAYPTVALYPDGRVVHSDAPPRRQVIDTTTPPATRRLTRPNTVTRQTMQRRLREQRRAHAAAVAKRDAEWSALLVTAMYARAEQARLSRWQTLDTDPHERRLFWCKVCHRISETPDKRCNLISGDRRCEERWAVLHPELRPADERRPVASRVVALEG